MELTTMSTSRTFEVSGIQIYVPGFQVLLDHSTSIVAVDF